MLNYIRHESDMQYGLNFAIADLLVYQPCGPQKPLFILCIVSIAKWAKCLFFVHVLAQRFHVTYTSIYIPFI